MRQFVSVLICGFALAGCGDPHAADSHDQLISDQLDVVTDMNDLLEGVTTPETAEAAKRQFQGLAERGRQINERARKLGEPSEEQLEALIDRHRHRYQKERDRMDANNRRLSREPILLDTIRRSMPDIGGPDWLSRGFPPASLPHQPDLSDPPADLPEVDQPAADEKPE
ncbi:MAG TPA: hypothetical protein VML55_01560 [Planctomycetaceae bacterium]|nr:hypothetical protein [Planctomycetaceae bacterium]